MRPKRWYACFMDGRVVAICHGAEAARRVNGRAYRSFQTREAAEIFSAWWNYSDSPRSDLRGTVILGKRYPASTTEQTA